MRDEYRNDEIQDGGRKWKQSFELPYDKKKLIEIMHKEYFQSSRSQYPAAKKWMTDQTSQLLWIL